MTVASVTPGGGAITTDCPPSTLEHSVDDPRYLGIPPQGNSTSSSASAPSNRLRKPLYDISLNTLKISPTTLTFSNYVNSVNTSCSTQSSYTPPTSNTTPVSASPLSMSWDGRYKKLQQMSLGAATFLTFLCSLHPDDIPEALFCRMWSTRECWNCEGEIEHVNVSVNAPLVDVLTRQTQFNENIQLLESFRFIKIILMPTISRIYRLLLRTKNNQWSPTPICTYLSSPFASPLRLVFRLKLPQQFLCVP